MLQRHMFDVALPSSLTSGFADNGAVTLCICWPAQASCLTRNVSASQAKVGRLEQLSAAQASPQSPLPFNMVCQPSAAVCNSHIVVLCRDIPAMCLADIPFIAFRGVEPGLLAVPHITYYVCPPKWCFLALRVQNRVP